MSPKRDSEDPEFPLVDGEGIFNGLRVYMVVQDVQPRRLEVWKQKLFQMGANLEDCFSKRVTHVLTANCNALLQQIDKVRLQRFKGMVLLYQWLEDCLKNGTKLPEGTYRVRGFLEDEVPSAETDELSPRKRPRVSSQIEDHESPPDETPTSPNSTSSPNDLSSVYKPPDLNRNVTQIFEKLVTIYKALGEQRRSFSYYKAISVIEKLPFKIKSADQIRKSPGIGKSMQDHIQEIVATGKMSKLEHLERDEKVRTLCLFGEVWGLGPATSLKLYEKGHRTLDDLKNESSLTRSQKLGLQYFEDMKCRIPRHQVFAVYSFSILFSSLYFHQVAAVEKLLQSVGKDILEDVIIICGGSYRRGKPDCGDLDVVITHPDGDSHKGFLNKYVKILKERNFLREDLVFSTHSLEGSDSGVDTYFGLCTFPGRDLRHRIDLKVYPKKIYAFGLLAWTGNDVLNRRLRLLAESKGYLLDDTGLYPAIRGKERRKGTLTLQFDEEKEVFDFLGFPWLEPHQRNL